MRDKDDQQRAPYLIDFQVSSEANLTHIVQGSCFSFQSSGLAEKFFSIAASGILAQAFSAIGVKSADLAAFEAARSGIFRV